MVLSSSGVFPASGSAVSNFSTGNDSPVRLAWVKNKSLQDKMRRSAGIMSPAAS